MDSIDTPTKSAMIPVTLHNTLFDVLVYVYHDFSDIG